MLKPTSLILNPYIKHSKLVNQVELAIDNLSRIQT